MGQGRAFDAETAGAVLPHVWFLPAEPVSASVLRRELKAFLGFLPPVRIDDVVLQASELVANAVLHGAGPITVSVWPGGHALRVEVTDTGGGAPRLVPATDGQDETGRGLLIVDALADSWGVLPLVPGPGKTVWFEIDCAPDTTAPPSV
jgi:anti-sigma regulatory factor (Ser/Thr protein kinase)